MFNLLVKVQPWGDGHDRIERGRIGEFTSEATKDRFDVGGVLSLDLLMAYPTLFVQETAQQPNRFAQVGRITGIVGDDPRHVIVDYYFETGMPPIPNDLIERFSNELDIRSMELERTHWAVKDIDLYRFLYRNAIVRRQRPTVFSLSDPERLEPTLLSAMMPFAAEFTPVYRCLQRAAVAAGLHCRRADDFWENPAIIQDIVSLIDKSSLVICDLTGRNPNVFYEVGIAHSLGREVILITQSNDDVPFDLRHLRFIRYVNNAQGLRQLKAALLPRLNLLATN